LTVTYWYKDIPLEFYFLNANESDS